VISVEAAHVNNAILLNYLTSKVAPEEPEITSNDTNIWIGNKFTDDELHFGMPGRSKDYNDAGDASDNHNAIFTTSQQWQATTNLERIDLRSSAFNGEESDNGNDMDADEEESASQVDDGSTQNVEHWGCSVTALEWYRDSWDNCEDSERVWKEVYYREVEMSGDVASGWLYNLVW
jgi:hypothetical protein